MDFGACYINCVGADKLSDCHQFHAIARKLPLYCLSGTQTACHSGRPLSDALNSDKKLKEGVKRERETARLAVSGNRR